MSTKSTKAQKEIKTKLSTPDPKADPTIKAATKAEIVANRKAAKSDLIPAKKKQRIVALVGSASSTLGMVPWDDKAIEMWTLAWRKVPRIDRAFDMHPIGPHRKNVPKNYIEFLSKLNVPVYTVQDISNAVPKGQLYPLKEIQDFNRSLDPYWVEPYFACSVAYMLNMAIYERVDEIQLYGLDFVADGEYSHQRPNMEYYIGIARGLGIRVYLPKDCAMCEFPYVYGYESKSGTGFVDKEMLIQRIREYKKRHTDNLAMAYVADGAMQEAQQLMDLIKHQERGGSVKQMKLKNMEIKKEPM
jgi:hypothetical protein